MAAELETVEPAKMPGDAPVIMCRLKGGLGNQLFQYAAARALAQQTGVPLKLDAITGFSRDQQYQRTFKLDCFNVSAPVASLEEIMAVRRTARLYSLLLRTVEQWRRDRSGKYYYAKLFDMKIRRPLYLDGYWQSEEYFRRIAGIIRSEYTLRIAPGASARHYWDGIGASQSVAIHVRRAQFEPACPVSYYSAALARIREQIRGPHFFVFSDDFGWVRRHFPESPELTYVMNRGQNADCEDLWLLSCCKHHIIANSTFSWWGAWLAMSPAGRVVAPKRWWNSRRVYVRDLLPERWETID